MPGRMQYRALCFPNRLPLSFLIWWEWPPCSANQRLMSRVCQKSKGFPALVIWAMVEDPGMLVSRRAEKGTSGNSFSRL